MPHRQRRAVERWREITPSDGDDVVRRRPQLAAEEEDFQTGVARIAADEVAPARVVADEQIADAEGEAVKGAGGRHPGMQVPRPAEVLHGRLRPTAEHFQHQATPARAASSRAR